MASNRGFIEPEITKDNYVLGGFFIPEEIVNPSGQWDNYLPTREIQHQNGIETSNCTAYATLNGIEGLYKCKYGVEPNYSERYTGVLAGTYPPGNDPHKVCEAIRKFGVINDENLPFSTGLRDIDEYYSPQPMKSSLIYLGKKWLETHVFKHEWVFTGGTLESKREKLKQALKYSPIGVSVYAWQKEGAYYTKPHGATDNHWTLLYGWTDAGNWKIYDSYDATLKVLHKDYNFGFAKRFYITKQSQKGFWQLVVRWWRSIWR